MDYDLDQQREAFGELVETASQADLLVAYLPEASLGTAIELWEAYHHGRPVVVITPMRENWVINLVARAVFPTLDAFEAFVRDGGLADLTPPAPLPFEGRGSGYAGAGRVRLTLDLGRLSAEIRGMSDHLAANRGVLEARIAGARDLLATADREALAAAAEAKRGAVIPVEDLTTRVAGDTLPDGYQVLATDGSDIEPDRHGPALCYVINVGWAVIEYGAQPRAELASAPALYYRPDDLYVRDGNRQAPIQGSRLGAKRAVAEMQRLAALCAAGHWEGGTGDGEGMHGSASSSLPQSPSPVPERVALSDGLLLLGNYWEGPEGFVRDYFVGQFKAALEELQALEVPVAAYIDRPRGADVIGLLRLDPRHQRDCAWCAGQGTNRAACALEGLADRLLFPDLAPGERSALFESRSLAQHYPPALLPRFFYVRVGREVARVELPVWAAERPGPRGARPGRRRGPVPARAGLSRGAGSRPRAGGDRRRRAAALRGASRARARRPRPARPAFGKAGQQAGAGGVAHGCYGCTLPLRPDGPAARA